MLEIISQRVVEMLKTECGQLAIDTQRKRAEEKRLTGSSDLWARLWNEQGRVNLMLAGGERPRVI